MSVDYTRALRRSAPRSAYYGRHKPRFRLIFGYVMIITGLITGIMGFIKNI